jgi:hypothetical protein
MFIFCLACLFGLVTAVIDVKTAYLNADIEKRFILLSICNVQKSFASFILNTNDLYNQNLIKGLALTPV